MSPPISTRSSLADLFAGWPPPVLDPGGPYSDSVTTLAWALLAMGAAVFVIVCAALWIALRGPARLRDRLGGETMIWIGGVAFPVVVLTALLIWGLSLTSRLAGPLTGHEMRVRVTGEMWWWRVAYLDGAGRVTMHDANEVHIPAGRPVVLELESADVIHSFWVPRLAGKLDMIPGRRNLLRIQADAPGTYGGQCAEYCGGPHALMGFVVVAHSSESWARWLAARRTSITRTNSVRVERSRDTPGTAPASLDFARDERGLVEQGAELFASAGCAACHRVRGTAANGLAGPDLSHIASRRTLGAGILPNNRGTLIGWIANSQSIKPGNRMPDYDMLTAEELNALAAWLETLK